MFTNRQRVPAGSTANLVLRVRDQKGETVIFACPPQEVEIYDPAGKKISTEGPSYFQRPNSYRLDYQTSQFAIPGNWKAVWLVNYIYKNRQYTERIPFTFEVFD